MYCKQLMHWPDKFRSKKTDMWASSTKIKLSAYKKFRLKNERMWYHESLTPWGLWVLNRAFYALNNIWLQSDKTVLGVDRIMHYILRVILAAPREREGIHKWGRQKDVRFANALKKLWNKPPCSWCDKTIFDQPCGASNNNPTCNKIQIHRAETGRVLYLITVGA